MINEIDDKLGLGLDRPFAAMRLKGEKHTPPRIAYDSNFIETWGNSTVAALRYVL